MDSLLAGTYDDDDDHVRSPFDPIWYGMVVQVEVPESVRDPNHWGHLVWTYLQFLQRSFAQEDTVDERGAFFFHPCLSAYLPFSYSGSSCSSMTLSCLSVCERVVLKDG
eukprot:CAMPEP_0116552454 /NCGR_PEP_ID=MMETSP0397-20121206/6500_1 /TAXON_ID=216820 /ORGANISM="Cyclophora tenuis, Strain ECT3854" /LENGTH=108 /DNA_ID=CAMNT_0004077415 /DNA_START=90 /DNA_END=412 /DNA_ORIENTATION=+